MEQVMEQRKDVKAMIIGGAFAGQEWRLKALEDRINSGKHRENFILRDFRQDVENLHCLFDIFALPSIANDSFPTAVLEAMASGKPVVAFKNGGVVEMIQEEENGLFAEFGDSKSLAEKILKLVEDKELREKMGKNNSIRQRQYFSKENFVQSFNEFYSDVNA
jgi:glycosyltransferase involved in cell wall biosynthesis